MQAAHIIGDIRGAPTHYSSNFWVYLRGFVFLRPCFFFIFIYHSHIFCFPIIPLLPFQTIIIFIFNNIIFIHTTSISLS